MEGAGRQEFLYLFPSTISEDATGAIAMHWAAPEGAFAKLEAPKPNESLASIQGRPGALSAEECRRVIEFGEALPRSQGRVELSPDAYRVSHIAWIEPGPQTHWLFHKLAVLFAEANHRYRLELAGFVDALQYTVYGADQHFDWHMDLGTEGTSTRKLSMTIQLSDSAEYSGGELEFMTAAITGEARQKGAATIFPSFMPHRVSPVGQGIRRSLVAWACGPAFR